MKYFRYYFLLISVVFFISDYNSLAQLKIGQWRDHYPYLHLNSVVSDADYIYGFSSSGYFTFDLVLNEVTKYSKTNGLSDIGIDQVAYSELSETIVLAYENGNIDLLKNGKVNNLPSLYLSLAVNDKRLNSIYIEKNLAYLASNFGIICVNLDNSEIIDTYFLRNDRGSIKVNDLCIYKDSIFVASDSGMYVASVFQELHDPINWHYFSLYNDSLFTVNQIVATDSLYLVANDSSLYSFANNQFNWIKSFDQAIQKIKSIEKVLYVVTPDTLYNLNSESNFTPIVSSPKEFHLNMTDFLFHDEDIWLADYSSGLGKFSPATGTFSFFAPNSPYSSNSFELLENQNQIIVSSGGFTDNRGNLWRKNELHVFKDNYWNSLIDYETIVFDVIQLAVDPFNPNVMYGASISGGLVQYENNRIANVFSPKNSPLDYYVSIPDYVRVGGVAFDKDGILWTSISGTATSLYSINREGKWQGYRFSELSYIEDIGRIFVSDNNFKWILLENGNGLGVLDDAHTPNDLSDDRFKKINLIDEYGDLITNYVFDIKQDTEGTLYFATDMGVLICYYPDLVFNSDFFVVRPKVEKDGIVDYLLQGEKIRAIVIDPAGRKWMASVGSGVYLLSKDLQTELYHFTKNNSPIPDNDILDIVMNEATGELFISTKFGIVSFMSQVSKSDDPFARIKIFPNPIYLSMHEMLTIDGLQNDADIVIVDVLGHEIYRDTSLGGRFTWNLYSFEKRLPTAGIYIVLAVNSDGSKKVVGKIMIKD